MRVYEYKVGAVIRLVLWHISFIGAWGILAAPASAQWASCTSGPSGSLCLSPNDGNVGIGTTTPGFSLDLESGGVVTSGYYNIAWLARASISESGVMVGYHSNGTIADYPVVRAGGFSASGLALAGDSANEAEMFIAKGGNVGIGTTNPQHLLHVAGTIGAEEVIVSSTGADYVFGTDYRLAPLSEVADYVKENHHLPGIPSAEEVKENGLSVGDMQAKLLAKVEELTLHMIEAEEHSKRLEQENLALKQETQTLRERVEKVESGAGVKR